MSEVSAHSVAISIQSMLDQLPSIPSWPSIFTVDRHLRSGGWDYYEPDILAVGPYHCDSPKVEGMEELKYRYVKRLLDRKKEQNLDRYITFVASMEELARKCYAKPLDLDQNAFVSLMVVDGFFLIELFRCCGIQDLRDKDDPIFRYERIMSQLRHDILLFENQLPFFVLNHLFNMTKCNEYPNDDLITLALGFFEGMTLNLSMRNVLERLPIKNIDHLCGLIHDVWCLPFAETIAKGYVSKTSEQDNWDNIKSISGLRESGVKFRKAEGIDSLMHIRFVNGVLKIPQLSIFDETASQFRNMIVYEQYLPYGEVRYVSDYTFFMHCLVNNSNDVELLHSRGIIKNCLGSDEEICLMFNRLGRNIVTSSNFCYSQVFCSVNRHCRRRATKWKAILSRNYFSNPWTIISFLGGIMLLGLTFIQATYTVMAYHRGGG